MTINPPAKLCCIIMFLLTDGLTAFSDPKSNVSYYGHFIGFIVGFVIGVTALEDEKEEKWEKILKVILRVVVVIAFIALITANIIYACSRI